MNDERNEMEVAVATWESVHIVDVELESIPVRPPLGDSTPFVEFA